MVSNVSDFILEPEVSVDIDQLCQQEPEEKTRRKRILLFANIDHPNTNVIDDIQQFIDYSRHEFTMLNPIRINWYKDKKTKEDQRIWDASFNNFDILMIHYSMYIIKDVYIPHDLAKKISKFKGVKIQTIRDEYRFINEMSDKMSDLGVDILFSALRPKHITQVYHSEKLSNMFKIATLPGFASEWLADRDVPPIREREYHLTYRSRELPPIVGSFGLEKLKLGDRFRELAPSYGLNVDVSVKNEDRVYGEDWVQLQTSGKAVLSAPGGSSLFDFTGEARKAADAYEKKHPDARAEETIKNALSEFDGNIVHEQLTPRSFEAIALRTPLVMPISDYRGVLQPWQHYIPLEDDFANMEEVATRLKDDVFLQDMADRVYEEIIVERDYSRRGFVEKFDRTLDHLVPLIERRNRHGRPGLWGWLQALRK